MASDLWVSDSPMLPVGVQSATWKPNKRFNYEKGRSMSFWVYTSRLKVENKE